jgi:hypothetical protein
MIEFLEPLMRFGGQYEDHIVSRKNNHGPVAAAAVQSLAVARMLKNQLSRDF